MYNFVKKLKYVSMNVQITNAFSETYPNYSIDYRLFHIMKRIEYTGPWERFLPRRGPNNKKNEILPILKIFTI